MGNHFLFLFQVAIIPVHSYILCSKNILLNNAMIASGSIGMVIKEAFPM